MKFLIQSTLLIVMTALNWMPLEANSGDATKVIDATRNKSNAEDTSPRMLEIRAEEPGEVWIRYVSDRGSVFRGNIKKDTQLMINTDGKLDILCPDVEHISFVINGEILHSKSTGIGKVIIDPFSNPNSNPDLVPVTQELDDVTKPQITKETPDAHNVYMVQRGDTLASISKKHDLKSWRDLMKANPNLDPTKLEVGQSLNIPSQNEGIQSVPAEKKGDEKAENIPLNTEQKELLANAQKAMDSEDYNQAISLYWNLTKSNPNSADNWFMLANAYAKSEQWLEVEATILDAIRIGGEQPQYMTLYKQIQSNK